MDEELRLPVVLYHLEGRSQAEVAVELGINQSTVSAAGWKMPGWRHALREKAFEAAGVEALPERVALPAFRHGNARDRVAVPKTLVAAMGKLAVSGLVPTTLLRQLCLGRLPGASQGAGLRFRGFRRWRAKARRCWG